MESGDVPAVELRGLRKVYGEKVAVDGVDLTIPQGQIVALLGPNGAGKSTTIDMALGLIRSDGGSVRLFGGTPQEAVAQGAIGAMLQTGGLPEYTSVRELLTVMASLYPHPVSVDEVITQTGLEEVAGQRASKLSGGQTQRVRFALTLVSDPRLLVLDEPTAALDVQARHDFWQVMRAYAGQGRTVIFATHYLEEADEFADRIVLMAGGRIVADGSSTEIKSVVDGRTIRATLPDVPLDALNSLPGLEESDRHGDTVVLRCHDSDSVLRALLSAYPQARDIEVQGGGLDEAFRRLTGTADSTPVVEEEEILR